MRPAVRRPRSYLHDFTTRSVSPFHARDRHPLIRGKLIGGRDIQLLRWNFNSQALATHARVSVRKYSSQTLVISIASKLSREFLSVEKNCRPTLFRFNPV